MFTSEKFVHFLDVKTKSLSFRSCINGQSISTIAVRRKYFINFIKNQNQNVILFQKSPVANHLAIAENGEMSNIFIHKFPNMDIIAECSSGTNHSIDSLSFSCSGEQLATQSNAPAFEITIWNWKTQAIHLQYKSNYFDSVLDMKFSTTIERYMFTGSVKSLQFWDIVRTFTGLKLLHHSGRFGKFKSCDLLCVCPESSNRVLTTCDWGNILVWEKNCVKFEICRKNRKPCHTGAITQIHLNDERLYTIGMDNFVRIWFWDTVALTNMKENDRIIEFEITYEYEIEVSHRGDDDLLSFAVDNDETCYIHDGNGAIWKAAVNKNYTDHEMEVIFCANSKDIVDVATSPVGTGLITIDVRGILCLYNFLNGRIRFHHRFPIPSSALVWWSRVVSCSVAYLQSRLLPLII